MFRYVMSPLVMGLALTFASCDDDTAFIGSDIMPGQDDVSTSHDYFNVYTQSVKVDSVPANTNDCYLGSIIDPETRAMTTCGFLAQFHVMENYKLPQKDRMIVDENGAVVADSCDIRISFDRYYGDSLKTMKLYVDELDTLKVMRENVPYFTNLNPADFVAENGVKTAMAFAVKDLARPDNETNGGQYYRSVVVRLPASFGSFIMNKYYENPNFFKNSYNFIHHVCAGFHFHTEGSVGAMLNADVSTMNVYFRYRTKNAAGRDTIVDGMHRMAATEEVLQNTQVENKIPDFMLDEDNEYSYLKTPTGIFTEVTLPVAEIVGGKHSNDTINAARISFRRHKDMSDSDFRLAPPADLLMVRKNIASEFFEDNRLPDVDDSYLTSFNSFSNSYDFSNIGQMITVMKIERDKGAGVLPTDNADERNRKYEQWEANHPDWNKVMLIPVKADYTTSTDIYGYVTKKLLQVRSLMGLNSVKLEGGKSNTLKITVIYSSFNNK